VTDTGKFMPLYALACLAPLVFLTLLPGPLPDSDRAAHTMWSRQLVSTGRLVISPDGVVNDWRAYYPNTVPKPGDMLLSLFGVLAGSLMETLMWLGMAWLVLLAAVKTAPERNAALLSGLFIGVNPVFLNLCITRSPAVPFLALVFLGCAKSSGFFYSLASLVRPEGFLYGGWGFLKKKQPVVPVVLALSAGVWILLNAGAAGDLFWSGREVRYCVAAMGYHTPNLITFPPWFLLRAVMVLGPFPMAALVCRLGKWNLRKPVGLNLLFLWAGLGFGSLVLPRYADQVLLLAVPFAIGGVLRAFSRLPKAAVAALCILGAMLPWMETVESWKVELLLRKNLPLVAAALPRGVVAANELLVPRLALLQDIHDPSGKYVALDRAVWEGVEMDDLAAFGVTSIVLFHNDFYLSDHARNWFDNRDTGIRVFNPESIGAQE